MTDIQSIVRDVLGPDGLVAAEGIDAYAVDGVVPEAAALPAARQELAGLLEAAGRRQLAVAARGGGTKMGWGCPPRRLDLVIGTTRVNQVLAYEPADLTITVEAGMTVAKLQDFVAQHRQFLPLNPPFAPQATIGGVLATNASGPWRLTYGTARDCLLGVEIVLADGQVAKSGGRVVKNVTGYDLCKLLIGSFGTLGIITAATLKVAPLPAARGTLLARFPDMPATIAGRSLAGAPLEPWSLEILDGEAARLLRDGAGHDGQCGKVAAILDSLVPGRSIEDRATGLMAIEFAGAKAAVARQISEAARQARARGAMAVAVEGGDTQGKLWQAIGDLGRRAGETSFVARLGLLPSQLPSAIGAVEEARRISGLRLGVLVRAAGAVLYVFGPALRPADVEGHENAAESAALTALREGAASLAAGMVVEECPVRLKDGSSVWGSTRAEFALMHRVKRQFDPLGLLNPGRFLGGI